MSILLALGWVALAAVLTARLLAPTPALAPLPAASAARPELERVGRLFGAADRASGALGRVDSSEPSLRLAGVILEGGHSLALISINGAPARALPVGAVIGAATRIVEIGAEQVTLVRQDGQRLALKVPPRGSSSSGKEPSRNDSRPLGAAGPAGPVGPGR